MKSLGVDILRSCPEGTMSFQSVFQGFERVGAVHDTFGESTERILRDLKVDVIETRGYLHIDPERGTIVVNRNYLREGQEDYIYLDVVHELVHIRQLMDGRELFDRTYSYVDRPTEVEAYRVTIAEARRIGLSDEKIADYLKVEWVTEEDFKRFLHAMGVENGRH
ncbi:MAG TPA: hypothetical protein VEJ36_03490 [Nitrososphaerales archaeon]|nr:hypothetical protein [Nitrososphaerales archaeon]